MWICVAILVLVGAIIAIALYGLSQTEECKRLTPDQVADEMGDPTTGLGCLNVLFALVGGLLIFLLLAWLVYGCLGAEPSGASSLPWAPK